MASKLDSKMLWGARLGSLLIKGLGKTWQVKMLGLEREQRLIESKRPFFYAFWHGKLLTLAYTHRNRGATVLISQSRDGGNVFPAVVVAYCL